MTVVQSPREHDRQLATLQGFRAYREVVATADIRHAQNELHHIFGDAITPVDYNDPRFGETVSKVTVVSRDLGVRMVRSACNAGVELDVMAQTPERLAKFAAQNNRVLSTYGSTFTKSPSFHPDVHKISLTVEASKGARSLEDNRRGIAKSVANYALLAMPTQSFELSFPLALTSSSEVAEQIEDLCITRYMHVPLGPLIIER